MARRLARFIGTLLIYAGSAIIAVGALLALLHWAPSWLLLGLLLMFVGGFIAGVVE